MLVLHCDSCQKNTVFLTIPQTIAFAAVSRSTIYHWMVREWIHWRELPSGRRVICRESLSHSARAGAAPPAVHEATQALGAADPRALKISS